jgi:hypothetical protein
MRTLALAVIVSLLAGCGVETASTAVTVAAAKQREAEEAKRTLADARARIEAGVAAARTRQPE